MIHPEGIDFDALAMEIEADALGELADAERNVTDAAVDLALVYVDVAAVTSVEENLERCRARTGAALAAAKAECRLALAELTIQDLRS